MQNHLHFCSRALAALPLQWQIPPCRCGWSRRQALSTQVPEAETSTDFEPASASHRRAAATLLEQPQSCSISWSFVAAPPLQWQTFVRLDAESMYIYLYIIIYNTAGLAHTSA